MPEAGCQAEIVKSGAFLDFRLHCLACRPTMRLRGTIALQYELLRGDEPMMPSATPPPNDSPPQANPVNIEVRRPSGLSPTTLHIVNIVLIAAILAVVFGFFGAILYRVSFDST